MTKMIATIQILYSTQKDDTVFEQTVAIKELAKEFMTDIDPDAVIYVQVIPK